MTRVLNVWSLLALALIGHVGLTVFLAWSLNLWIDEAYTLETTGSGIAHALRQAITFELQPPAYYVLVAGWRTLAPGLFFTRLFSVCCVAASLPLAARVSQRYLGGLHPGWLAVAMAFNPAAIWAATEARPYALALLLATALLWLFHAGFLASPRRHARPAFALVAILALYTQYYLGFLLASGAVALAALGRWRALRDYLGWMLLVFAALLPLLLALPAQVAPHTTGGQPSAPWEAIDRVLARFENLVTAAGSLPGGRAGRWLFRGALAAVVLTALAAGGASLRERLASARAITAPLAICLGVMGFLVAVQLVFGAELAKWRYMVFLLPAGLLLVYGLVASAGPGRPVAALTLLLLCSSGWALSERYRPLAKSGDHARVAEWLGRTAGSEPIFVFPGEKALALDHYLAGRGELVAIPAAASLTHYDVARFAWRDREQVVRSFQQIGPGEPCWLVTYGTEELLGVPLHGDLLEDFVAAEFLVLGRHRFHGETLVRQLRRRPDGSKASPGPP